MVSKVSGTWSVEMLGRTHEYVFKNGKLTVDGKAYELKPSTSQQYPAVLGWFEYKANSYIQVISPTNIKVAASLGNDVVSIPVTMSPITYTVEILGRMITFVLANGKLSVQGKAIELTASDNAAYPATAGWFTFKLSGIQGFIKISPPDIEVVMLAGSTKIPTSVAETKPVPSDSKYLFIIFLHQVSSCVEIL